MVLFSISYGSLAVSVDDVTKTQSSIKGIIELPIYGIRAVETNGQIIFLSENGRFVFTGQMYDLWQRKSLNTLPQMKAVANRLQLANMQFDFNKLNVAVTGHGPQEVIIFVDPQCSVCHELIGQASEKELISKYTFKFVGVPVLGDKSNELVRAMSCIEDRRQAFEALELNKLSIYSKSCSSERHDRTLITAQLLNVRGVPYSIAPDGRVKVGAMNLKSWLRAES